MNPGRFRRGMLITLVAAATAVGYGLFVFLPAQVVTANLRDELRQKQEFIVEAERLKSVMKRSREEHRQTGIYLATWNEDTPTETELSQLYRELLDASRTAGTRITNFTPMSAEPLRTVFRLPIRMTLEGPLASQQAFLAALEGLPPAIWVEQLRISPVSDAGDVLYCDLLLIVFANNPENSG